ncbi:hypothetical protein C0995_012039 [Termitomyces sp. Mi166|nr:hypothetical protein C0995_012039 [Termitomyces sp. Mi166\
MSMTSHPNDDKKKPELLVDNNHPESVDLNHAVPSRPPIRTSSRPVYNMYERYDDGIGQPKLGPSNYTDILFPMKDGFKGWGKMVLRDGWKYFILAAFDVEGNFLVVKGVLICIVGLGLLVASDELTEKDWTALDRAKGDGFMIAGATLYGLSNATEEFFVRKRPLYEVVGQLGMWGTLINGIQAAGLEHDAMKLASWNRMTIGILIAYTSAMFILYTVAPMLYRLASSTYYNLSLLTSDFWGLLFAEEQGTLNPTAPSYVNQRGAVYIPADSPSSA